jgi:RimJ/RimL family protein N-acetyltransferase
MGFTAMGLEEICSLPQATNPPSSRVCERIGMRFDRSITCSATDRRGAVEARMYVVTADEWSPGQGTRRPADGET